MQSDYRIVGETIAEPHKTTEFYVGVYENVIPQPHMNLHFDPPDAGSVSASLVRLEEHGEYTLVYYFKNVGDLPCRITIRARWPDEA